jgi:hypothetical protein
VAQRGGEFGEDGEDELGPAQVGQAREQIDDDGIGDLALAEGTEAV